MPNINYTSLLIGVAIGWLLLPMLLSMLNSRRKTSAASPTA